MRVYFSELDRDLKLYKNREIVFGDQTNNTNDHAIILLSSIRDDFFDIYEKELFSNQFIKSYYIPRYARMTSMRNERIKYNQKDHYELVESRCSMINYTRPRIRNYGNRNMYYDMFPINRSFIDKYSATASRRRMGIYQNVLMECISGVKHKNKYLVINPKDKIKNGGKDPLNMIYDLVYHNALDNNFFKDIPIIVYSRKTGNFFKTIISNRSDGFDHLRFERMINIIYNMDGTSRFTKEEQKEIEDMDKDLDNAKNQNSISNRKPTVREKITKGLGLDVKKPTNEEIRIIKQMDNRMSALSKNLMDDEDIDEDILDDDEEFLEYLNELKDTRITKQTEEERDLKKKRLKKKQDEAFGEVDKLLNTMHGSIDDIINDYQDKTLEIEEIDIDTINPELKISKLKDLDRNYNKLQSDEDLAKILTSFNDDPEFPLYVTDFKKEDSSDEFSQKETLSVKFEDTHGEKHNVKIDLPKMIDDRFMFLNNGKKSISKQLTLLPVLKTADDRVQLTSNYNSKMFIYRFGQKTDPNVDRFNKFITKELNKYDVKYFLGSNRGTNKKYRNTLEYDDISEYLISMEFKGFKFNFNREEILDMLYEDEVINDINSVAKNNEYPFGYNKEKQWIFYVNLNDSRVYVRDLNKKEIRSYDSIIQCLVSEMVSNVDEGIADRLSKQTASKRFIYSRATILNKKMPLIILLGFYYGLEKVLNEYGVNWRFEKDNKQMSDSEKLVWNRIRFKDGWFMYKIQPLRHALLVNGLTEINTEEINFKDLNSQSIYLDIFDLMFGSRNIAKGLNNFMSLFLDPITKDVLKLLDLPTDLLNLILYSNSLLEDSSSEKLNDLSNYRIRGNEIIYAELYNVLANTYKVYKDTSKGGNPHKMSVKQDELLKQLLTSPLVDEYSVLNPVLEAEKLGTVTYKGIGGTQLDEAFTLDMRAFDESMTGALGVNTPDSDKVGVSLINNGSNYKKPY